MQGSYTSLKISDTWFLALDDNMEMKIKYPVADKVNKLHALTGLQSGCMFAQNEHPTTKNLTKLCIVSVSTSRI